MKRFWDAAAVVADADGCHAVRLDGRPMRLPGGPLLRLRSLALAQAIASEWSAAPAVLTAEDVPLTRIAGTAQERVAPDTQPSVDALAAYGETDLLCYRAETPEGLVARQQAQWQPWLDWAASVHGAKLLVTTGVLHVAQPAASLAALRATLANRSAEQLAGLGILVPATGSLVLGLAVADGALDAAGAHALAALDELFQAEHWGEDHDAVARRRNVAADIVVAARFMALAAEGPG